MALDVLLINDILQADLTRVGGKAKALALLADKHIPIPFTACVPTDFYHVFVRTDDLLEKINFELGRKAFADMRWEEIWDCSLRIRNRFLRQDLPPELKGPLTAFLEEHFKSNRTAVRSSAPSEDSSGSSFAGLHESYINIEGSDAIIDHIKLVWASLWSDAALLYRQELGLGVQDSAMAVLIQNVVDGNASGIAFTRNPTDPDSSVIEAVLGLNQGLVDGVVEPDRWILDRESGAILKRQLAEKVTFLAPSVEGVSEKPVPKDLQEKPVLEDNEVEEVFDQAGQCESVFRSPQDVEWTLREHHLCVLQSRPITTLNTHDDDDRSWYLSLRRSFENLEKLRTKIVDQLIPAMDEEADDLDYELTDGSPQALIREIESRKAAYGKWKKVYWDEFIPFAHGIRLFGQFYNDTLKPDDPYEFVQLLQSRDMLSLERNALLETMAKTVRGNSQLMDQLAKGIWPDTEPELTRIRQEYEEKFGEPCRTASDQVELGRKLLCNTVLQLAKMDTASGQPVDTTSVKEEAFLAHFAGPKQNEAKAFLELGRCSYKLRDDDNIHLGRIEAQLARAVDAAEATLKTTRDPELARLLGDLKHVPDLHQSAETIELSASEKDRQIVGQPAGPGITTAKARVIKHPQDLQSFQQGEILVCDAIDPTMTFIVPLAAGIVERRGGMLIHGAIIAREYGIACVTGVPHAIDRIRTGDTITVDGYLGIVTIGSVADCFDPPN